MTFPSMKPVVRKLRSWPPLNRFVTSGLLVLLKVLGKVPKKIPILLPRFGLVEATLPNELILKMWSEADETVTSRVFWQGWSGHEPETSTLFYELAGRARLVFDIGAHVGYFTLLAAYSNQLSSVFAFEPLPAAQERLRRNVGMNDLENVQCVPLAMANEVGQANLFHQTYGVPSGSTLATDFMDSMSGDRHYESSLVEVSTVDKFMQANGLKGLDLVKIDTESTEDKVIAGMEQTLRRDRPIIFCEVIEERPAAAIEKQLRELDYVPYLLTDSGPVICDSIAVDPQWRNYCFMPAEVRTSDLTTAH